MNAQNKKGLLNNIEVLDTQINDIDKLLLKKRAKLAKLVKQERSLDDKATAIFRQWMTSSDKQKRSSLNNTLTTTQEQLIETKELIRKKLIGLCKLTEGKMVLEEQQVQLFEEWKTSMEAQIAFEKKNK